MFKLLLKFKGWYATFIDYLGSLFPEFGVDTMEVGVRYTYKDENLSKKLTNLFVNTKVYIYMSLKYTMHLLNLE